MWCTGRTLIMRAWNFYHSLSNLRVLVWRSMTWNLPNLPNLHEPLAREIGQPLLTLSSLNKINLICFNLKQSVEAKKDDYYENCIIFFFKQKGKRTDWEFNKKWERHITRYMCFQGRKHVVSDMCSPVGKHISLPICVDRIGKHISLAILFPW